MRPNETYFICKYKQTNKNNMKEKLSRYDITMLKALMSNEVKLLRVFPYESHTREVVVGTGYSRITMEKNSLLYKRLVDIRKIANKYGFDDNKIVIQVGVHTMYHSDSLFLGFWDDNYSIGYSVQPCQYTPREFPKTEGSWGPGLIVKF